MNGWPTRRRLLALLAAGPAFAARADDTTLLRELRAGAAVLMRHTQTTPGVGDPAGWRLEDCASQRNLDAAGIAHARRIGRWFEAQRLAVTAVRHSPWCRTRDTAQLAFGRSEAWPALANIFEDRSDADRQSAEVRAYLRSMRPGQLAVLVSHGSTISHIVGGVSLAMGESVVVRAPSATGAPLNVLGRLVVP